MFGFGSIYTYLISVSLPIAFITAAALPHHKMSLIPQFDEIRSIPCSDISPERVQNFFSRVGMGSTGLLVAIVLGPIMVRGILRWRDGRRREEEQILAAAVVAAEDNMEGERAGNGREGVARQSLIFGENPDYHDDHDSTSSIPHPPLHHKKPVRHLRVHSFDELPPPTMEDVTPPRPSWGYPASLIYQPELPKKRSGQRRSPFNPIVPGMKTMWEESMDPVTGRKWRRKLVIYSGALGSFKTSNGELRLKENDLLES